MAIKTDRLCGLKIATIVIGIVCAIFTGIVYYGLDSKDNYFFCITIIAIAVSLILLILLVFGALDACRPEMIDGITHLILAVLLLIGAIVFAINLQYWSNYWSDADKALRILATILGFVNTILYFIIGLKCLGVAC